MVKNRSARHYTDNYYQAVCCFAHTAPLLLTLSALPALHRLHPSQIAPFARAVTGDTTSRVTNRAPGAALHGAHHLRPPHPVHHVHQCSRFTTTVRDHAGTAWKSRQESAQIGIASTRQITLLNPVESSLRGCLHG